MIVCDIGGLDGTALSYFGQRFFLFFPISLDFLRSKMRDEDVKESNI